MNGEGFSLFLGGGVKAGDGSAFTTVLLAVTLGPSASLCVPEGLGAVSGELERLRDRGEGGPGGEGGSGAIRDGEACLEGGGCGGVPPSSWMALRSCLSWMSRMMLDSVFRPCARRK